MEEEPTIPESDIKKEASIEPSHHTEHQTVHEPKKDSWLDKSINFIFSNDERKWLILIFLFGLLLRIMVSINNPPVPDEMVHGSHAIGISSLMPLSTMTQGPVWFYLVDFSYKIFGVHLWSGRFLAILFGAFSIFLIYLVSNLFFNKKISLIAAFLYAFSPYQLYWTRIYMDESLLFFIFLAIYIFIKDYRKKSYITPLSALFLGIGILIKIVSGAFILVFSGFVLFILYKNRVDKELFKKTLKAAIFFFIILGISLVPLVGYNYFLYKEKGIVDLPFAMYFGINTAVYQGAGLAHDKGFSINTLPEGLKVAFYDYLFKEDTINSLLFLFGIFYFLRGIKKDKLPKTFLLILFGFSFLFIVASILLQTHYTYFSAFFAIIGAPIVYHAARVISRPNSRKIIVFFLALILIFNLYSIHNVLTSETGTEKLRDFAIKNIKDTDLVIVDSRVYRGNIAWTFNDKNYIESNIFPQAFNLTNNLQGSKASIHTYFVECAVDDRGWGTIASQPEFNKSSEQFVAEFRNISQTSFDIEGGGSKSGQGSDVKGITQYRVYETYINANPAILQVVKQTHNFFFYEIPRNANPKAAFDYYTVNGGFDKLINFFAYLILFTLIILAIISPLFVLYLLYTRVEPEES